MRSWHPLRKRNDFQRLYREGTRFRSPLLTLVLRAEPQAGDWRAATVCSKKVGGAVMRNLLDGVTWREGTSGDLALICKPDLAEASFAEMARHVRRLVARAGLEEG